MSCHSKTAVGRTQEAQSSPRRYYSGRAKEWVENSGGSFASEACSIAGTFSLARGDDQKSERLGMEFEFLILGSWVMAKCSPRDLGSID